MVTTGAGLERVVARDGQTVLRFRGRLLASAVDPAREARDWVNACRESVARATRAIVLGFGSGYHLRELTREFPNLRILVIGCEPELYEAARQIHGDLDSVEWILAPNPEELLQSQRVRAYLKSPLAIVEHPSIHWLDGVRYREIRARLVARDPLFFADWLRWEPRLSQLFPLRAVGAEEMGRLLSIKDVERFVNARGMAEPRDVMMVRVLRELVK